MIFSLCYSRYYKLWKQKQESRKTEFTSDLTPVATACAETIPPRQYVNTRTTHASNDTSLTSVKPAHFYDYGWRWWSPLNHQPCAHVKIYHSHVHVTCSQAEGAWRLWVKYELSALAALLSLLPFPSTACRCQANCGSTPSYSTIYRHEPETIAAWYSRRRTDITW